MFQLSIILLAFCVGGKERERDLWKVLCRIKQSPCFLHLSMFQTEPFSSLESSFSGHTRLSPGCVITVCSGVLLSWPDKSWKTVRVHNWPLESPVGSNCAVGNACDSTFSVYFIHARKCFQKLLSPPSAQTLVM